MAQPGMLGGQFGHRAARQCTRFKGCHHCPSTVIARSQKLHGQRRRRSLAQAQYREEPSGWSNRNVRQQGPIQPAVWNEISQFSSSSAEQSQGGPLRIDQTWTQRQDRYGYDSGTESGRQSAIARDDNARRRLNTGGTSDVRRSQLGRNSDQRFGIPDENRTSQSRGETGLRDVSNATDSSSWRQNEERMPNSRSQPPNETFTESTSSQQQSKAKKTKPIKARGLWGRSFDFLRGKQKQPIEDDWANPMSSTLIDDEDDWGASPIKTSRPLNQTLQQSNSKVSTSLTQSNSERQQSMSPRWQDSDASGSPNEGQISRKPYEQQRLPRSDGSQSEASQQGVASDGEKTNRNGLNGSEANRKAWTVSYGRDSLDSSSSNRDPRASSRDGNSAASREDVNRLRDFDQKDMGENSPRDSMRDSMRDSQWRQEDLSAQEDDSRASGSQYSNTGAQYSSTEAEILEDIESDWDEAPEEWDEGDGPDITLLSPSETDDLLPVVPTAEQMGYAWGNAVDLWQRLGSAAFVTIITVKLNLILVASGAASYPFWGPLLSAANRNRALRKTGRHVGFWRTRVIDMTIERPLRNRFSGRNSQPSSVSKPTIRFLLGDTSGARSSVSVPLNKRYEAVQIGEPAEVLVLSSKAGFDTFKALKEVYFPESGLWMSEYPHINRNLFLDISLDIERARRQEMMAGAFVAA